MPGTERNPAPTTTPTLPTTVFQRDWYWPGPPVAVAGDPTSAGLDRIEHPVLSAVVHDPDTGGMVLTGVVSQATHPWVADHVVAGAVLMPGAAWVELASQAADQLGCDTVDELVLNTPMPLADQETRRIQVSVAPANETGRHPVTIYSRPHTTSQTNSAEWVQHASGYLTSRPTTTVPHWGETQWPPAGSTPVDTDRFYETLPGLGYNYGPLFQGVRAGWQRNEHIFAEITLPTEQDNLEQDQATEGFGIHPALLDAVLHTMFIPKTANDPANTDQGVMLPFAWNAVTLHATGATTLRVHLSPNGDSGISLLAVDPEGNPVISIASLVTRPVRPADLAPARTSHDDGLWQIHWNRLETTSASTSTTEDKPLQDRPPLLINNAGQLATSDPAEVQWILLTPGTPTDQATEPEHARAEVMRVVQILTTLLTEPAWQHTQIVVTTRQATEITASERQVDPVAAAIGGMVRTAQNEHPGRITLIDLTNQHTTPHDITKAVSTALPHAIEHGETQIAINPDGTWTPRLTPTGQDTLLVPDGNTPWSMRATGTGTVSGVELSARAQLLEPLTGRQVRVAVRAAGLNFRDVLIALGKYPGDASMGAEAAGVVVEVGPEVTTLAVGDRVTGMLRQIGPVAVADERVVTRFPDEWSFAQAATVPVVFLTAYYGLVDLAQLKAGEALLVHAGTGGVGMAAIQLARYLGVEVYATASPGKQDQLRQLGLDEPHIANSRTLHFEHEILHATQGHGVDAVLNSLTAEFIDASLRLLPRGGRFIEMGKTDIRPAEDIALSHPDVLYQAFDLMEVDPDQIHRMMAHLMELFHTRALNPLPLTVWDITQAPQALRYMSQARHTGKNVVTIPRPLDPLGVVLITGGTGTLGGLVAHHAVSVWGAR
ncbi:polyketide synthase dehydratase domain-containing protein, partial [Actinacidiphila glaucinigra]|uniref:polyketide synthase dehydratase domain-containing protein n=1 Tax=Actinacidiphila glaucinigra TaxID=235986 RepID=UPI0035DF7A47